ncbi:hypothetical protein AC579_2546 [Pseudocercospora musae]|uniref:DUF6604 domain-containing protein n=1 Tax=Pseudocercospora musae TaxID=113226 RepID=A0A139I384_9PEZI|nr:hypothetical protein AC579_2546 [Pseudocercospora musae]
MAKDTYLSTYKTYKAGTNKLISWLVTHARQAGAELSFLADNTSSRSGSKGSTISPAKYQVPVKELSGLAKAIADATPKIAVPSSILTLARSVVSLRKQATAFLARLSKSKQARAKAPDAGHRHFINVLEQVISILQPESEERIDPKRVANVFSALTVEEPTSHDYTASTDSKADDTDNVEYELDFIELDDIFKIFAFFKDINELRGYIGGLWKDYRLGNLDLMSAAVITDTALGIMKQTSEELGQSVENGSQWASIVGALETYINAFGGTTDAFSDWVCAGSAHKLHAFSQVLNPDCLPLVKAGHFGIYNPKQDRSRLSAMEKEREDVVLLMELLPEFAKLAIVKMEMPVPDELTTGLLKMMAACNINALPMHTIFATEVLLDIHHILREDAVRPFEELQAVGTRVIAAADEWLGNTRSRPVTVWPAENDNIFKRVRAVAQEWTQSDIVARACATTRTRAPGKPRPHWLLKNHPVLSGLLVFQLNALLQETGMIVCTTWGSMIYPAHIYNAAKQSADLDSAWPDIDYLISVHSPQRIFVGTPPTDAAEYLKRFLLAMGASASNFARNRRPGGRALIVPSKKGPRGLKTTSPVKDVFGPKYIYRKSKAVPLTRPNLIAMLAVASKAERTSTPSVELQAFAREMLLQKQFTPTQLLTIVREGVAAEELHLLFDYHAIHRKGYEILQTLRIQLHDRFVEYFGPGYLEVQLPFIVGYIFEVVRGSDRTAEDLGIDQNLRPSRMLYEASEALRQTLKDDRGSQSIEKARALSRAHRSANRK